MVVKSTSPLFFQSSLLCYILLAIVALQGTRSKRTSNSRDVLRISYSLLVLEKINTSVKRLSLTIWSLVALAAGLGLGILGHETAAPAFQRFGEVAKAVGAIFIAALQLTVLPLVITQLLSAISNAGAKSVGKLGVRAIVLFVLMLIASGLFAALLIPPMASRISVDPGTLASLTAGSANTVTQAAGRNAPAGSITDWLGSLLPNNLI